MKIIFVDGYNVINSWPNLKKFIHMDSEIVRQKLIDIMENYAVFNECKIFLVFDAHSSNTSGDRKVDISDNLSVIFTKQGELADTYIERVVHKIGRKSEIMVVTSDYLEQQTVFQRGAARISSLEFYRDVYDIDCKIKIETEKINATNNRSLLMDNLDDKIIDKLENIRKGS